MARCPESDGPREDPHRPGGRRLRSRRGGSGHGVGTAPGRAALRADERAPRDPRRPRTAGGRGTAGAPRPRDPDAAPTEGMFETLIERLLRRAGIEMPVRQYEVWDGDEFIARIDFGRSGSPWGKELAHRDATRRTGVTGLLVPLRASQVPSAIRIAPTGLPGRAGGSSTPPGRTLSAGLRTSWSPCRGFWPYDAPQGAGQSPSRLPQYR